MHNMPAREHATVWSADPHTIAKIAILKAYLTAWFQIMGRKMRDHDLTYVDGFAGPGRYTNHFEGSPVAALQAASAALKTSRQAWKAGTVRCVFIESDHERFVHLNQHVAPFAAVPRLQVIPIEGTFIDGMARLRAELPALAASPLFVFIDPFGATGAPFSLVADILTNPTAEVLINLDADGITRIMNAKEVGTNRATLDRIFGDRSWLSIVEQEKSFEERCRLVLSLYRSKLRALPGVGYAFPFEMRSKTGTLQYFLLFASQHHRGLEKMKEAMKRIDGSGAYCFSDARVGQERLIRFDHPDDYVEQMFDYFRGQSVSYDRVRDYALNETPFVSPKGMLAILERRGALDVSSSDPARRRGTLPDGKVDHIDFHVAWDSTPGDARPQQSRLL
jgi:three-Cys-motif partner protein